MDMNTMDRYRGKFVSRRPCHLMLLQPFGCFSGPGLTCDHAAVQDLPPVFGAIGRGRGFGSR